ncbi:MAG: hypothetical protein AAGG48_29505 [Planctomycetota bacterium]
MKIRFSIRHAAVFTLLCATSFAYYSHNAALRSSELLAIQQINRVSGDTMCTFHTDNMPLVFTTWTGNNIYVENCAPFPIRWIGLDAFNRVTCVEFSGESNPALINNLSAFTQLKHLSVDKLSPIANESIEFRQWNDAISRFSKSHPGITVVRRCHEPTSHRVNLNDTDSVSIDVDDPFGAHQPFSTPSNQQE